VHGEFKVPAGKLVVVDLATDAGRLRDVRVSGDFFLEPDDALLDIDDALIGAPADSTAADLTARIERALPAGTVMYGFSPRDVATAVRRALSEATSWTDHEWLLVHEPPKSPAYHMALDQTLIEEVAAGRHVPTLRVWKWASPCVVIGSFQSLRNEVDPDGAARYGIEVARRISGGGAMFIEPGNTITYSLYAPASLVEGLSFQDSYAFLDDWVLGALADLGIRATYQPLNDITSPAGKIAGAAQKRMAGPADRPRETLDEGHRERRQAGRPVAFPDRVVPGGRHRRDGRQLHPSLRSDRRRRDPGRARADPASGRDEVRDSGLDRSGSLI